MKNCIKKKNGFTLIEVIVSIALLAIIATAFMTLLSNSYADIFISGSKSDALFQAQKEVEFNMAVGTTESSDNLVIEYDSSVGVNPITIKGKIILETKSYNGSSSISLTSFIATR